eukprot:CAMPEP_0194129784 /NCGR_PEP_ID=MMETSP0152-20130528/989_1 /TAXON_ID=1049557 /ORGANISM="Thalassiothrix antarctica, Strain L6-D1" /LENGTH=169 /DNA_ID=CAMNT_0038824117 /DNA_START=185 /DNA_END=694 /DNA_ORIENTATION=-
MYTEELDIIGGSRLNLREQASKSQCSLPPTPRPLSPPRYYNKQSEACSPTSSAVLILQKRHYKHDALSPLMYRTEAGIAPCDVYDAQRDDTENIEVFLNEISSPVSCSSIMRLSRRSSNNDNIALDALYPSVSDSTSHLISLSYSEEEDDNEDEICENLLGFKFLKERS